MLITQIDSLVEEYQKEGAEGEIGFIIHPDFEQLIFHIDPAPKSLSDFFIAGHDLVGKLSQVKVGTQQAIAYVSSHAFFQGIPLHKLTLPVRLMNKLGVKYLVIVGKAETLVESSNAGVMLVRDHINFMGTNPLIGPNLEEFGPRFPDMTEAYSLALRSNMKTALEEQEVAFKEGILMGVTGPYQFSEAENQMAVRMGADAVSHRDVAEVIVARHAGMDVLSVQILGGQADITYKLAKIFAKGI